ncbi:fructosamine kinase family protein [Natronorarus salvus]|uniref:fructosamine kinase family protein n=1 Tax=Natronorarus salvus TaxID=3117733 RepID=UPI002F262488
MTDPLPDLPIDAEIRSVEPLSGGQIGRVSRVELADGRTVVAKTGPTDLTLEGRMLRYLEERGLPVPELLGVSTEVLVLSHVEGESRFTPAAERHAARLLADLHTSSAPRFGFPYDTLTGQLPLPNPWTDSWAEFYVEHRLRYAARRAHEDGPLPTPLAGEIEAIAAECDRWLAEPDAPALLHGDVWTENVLAAGDRITGFLDPAISYGHPEIELAYVDWTGTFGEAFFETYDGIRGIEAGFWETRRYLYRLFPLLVHVWHFGEGYVRSIERVVERLS